MARLLPLQVPDELRAERVRLLRLAVAGPMPEVRQPGWAALALADEGFDELWRLAYESASGSALVDLLGGIPLLLDSGLRARAYDRVTPLLTALPPEWVTPDVDAYLDQHPESRPAGTGTLDEEEGHGRGH